MDGQLQKRPRLLSTNGEAKPGKGTTAPSHLNSSLRTTGRFGVPGLLVTDHYVRVPLVYSAPIGEGAETIEVLPTVGPQPH